MAPPEVMAPDLTVAPALQPVLAQLQQLEPLFHGAGPGSSAEHFESLVAPEFWEVGASGRRYGRAFVLSVVKQRAHDPQAAHWITSDFQVSTVAPDLYLLTYTLQQPGRLTRRMTLWRQATAGWQAVYHQGTVVEPAAT